MGDDGAHELSRSSARRPIRRDRSGRYRLNLDGDERQLLRNLTPQFLELLDDPSQPVLKRLFPPAYADADDEEMQEEYRRLMQDDLVTRHRAELELLAETAGSDFLTEEEVLAWSRALNGVRLVLGTFLDVGEDDEPSGPDTPEEALYQWLTYLLGEAIEALSGQTGQN